MAMLWRITFWKSGRMVKRIFFLSVHAPYVKLNTTWYIVRAAVSAASVETGGRLTGTGMFRNNAASEMLRKGVPLSAISEELGHKC